MTDPDPKPPKDKTPPTEPPTEKPGPIIIDWGQSEIDPALKQSIELMTQQNQTLMQSNERMTKLIEEQNTKAALEDYNKLRTQKLAELEEIKEGMAEKYKDEKDIGIIENAIKIAKEFVKETSGFSEVKGPDANEQTDDSIQEKHWNPIGGKGPTSKLYHTDSADK